MAGQRGGLVAHPLHKVAVAAQGIDVVVEQVEARPVKSRRQPPLRNRHAHAVAQPLAQRSGGGLHAGGFQMLRMAGTAAVQPPESLDLVERDGQLAGRLAVDLLLHSGQVQHRVEQHRGMSAGEHKAVSGRPGRVIRVEPQHLVPQGVGHGGQSHGRARMAAVGFFHRVHRQRANGVDGPLLNVDRRLSHRWFSHSC